MKGRFSEGINFAGKLCRCLIIVGIMIIWLLTRSEENDNSKHIEEFSQLIRNSDDKLKSFIEELDP
jgi:hypothetical protein